MDLLSFVLSCTVSTHPILQHVQVLELIVVELGNR